MFSPSSSNRPLPNVSGNQTTVVLPPYFFGGTPAGRVVGSGTSHRMVRGGVDRELRKANISIMSPESTQPRRTTDANQSGAPPLKSLLENSKDTSLHQMTSSPHQLGPNTQPSMSMLSSVNSSVIGAPLESTRAELSMAHVMDPFYVYGEDFVPEVDMDDRCITVFGFDSTSAQFILDQFAEFGNICSYEIASGGNWMHIMFESRMQAALALGKNGKIFGNRVKVGVERCTDKKTIKRFRYRLAPSFDAQDDDASMQSSVEQQPDSRPVVRAPSVDTSKWSLPSRSVVGEQKSLVETNLSIMNDERAEDSRRIMRSMIASPAGFEDDMDTDSGLVSKVWTYLFG